MSLHGHKLCASDDSGAAAVGANTALFHGRRRGAAAHRGLPNRHLCARAADIDCAPRAGPGGIGDSLISKRATDANALAVGVTQVFANGYYGRQCEAVRRSLGSK